MIKPVESVSRYLRYSLKARTGFGIHSPFIFRFYNSVVKNGTAHEEYLQIAKIRREMITFTRYIKRNDLGAKAGDFSCDHRFTRVRDIARRTAISPAKGELLFRLIRDSNPETLLEFGTSLGISAMYMGFAAPGSRIVTMEGCGDSASIARENFEKAGLKNITLLQGRFETVLPGALDMLPVVDFVFFDGNHRYQATVDYFEACLKHIRPGSVFVFDDIHWSKEMEKAWGYIRRHPSVRVTIDLFHLGIVYFKEELSKEDFVLRY